MKSNKTRIKFTGTPGNVLNSLKQHRSERGDAQFKREGSKASKEPRKRRACGSLGSSERDAEFIPGSGPAS